MEWPDQQKGADEDNSFLLQVKEGFQAMDLWPTFLKFSKQSRTRLRSPKVDHVVKCEIRRKCSQNVCPKRRKKKWD